eukprot:3186751-Prymnesium_polylepis.2
MHAASHAPSMALMARSSTRASGKYRKALASKSYDEGTPDGRLLLLELALLPQERFRRLWHARPDRGPLGAEQRDDLARWKGSSKRGLAHMSAGSSCAAQERRERARVNACRGREGSLGGTVFTVG